MPTAPSDLGADATFLDYAAGSGQNQGTRLGQLPLGYAPLSSADQAQTAKYPEPGGRHECL